MTNFLNSSLIQSILKIKEILAIILVLVPLLFGISFEKPQLKVSYENYFVSYPKILKDECERTSIQFCNYIKRTQVRVIEIENISHEPANNFELQINGIKELYGTHVKSSSKAIEAEIHNNQMLPLKKDNTISFSGITNIPSKSKIRFEVYGEYLAFNFSKEISVKADVKKIDVEEKVSISGIPLILANNYIVVLIYLFLTSFFLLVRVCKSDD